MRDPYPEIEPFKTETVKASPLHELYLEQSGNPDGYPIVFLHGGPGGATDAKHRRYFDPAHYRIILFDQRGCGKSTPRAELEENTTWDLVHDIELIRKHLGIRQWIVFGGSWGSTLSLTYAIKNPTKVKGLILRGIFLCRKSEIQWFYQNGASNIFPDLWEDFWNHIPAEERGDMIAAYHKRLTSEEEKVRLEAASIWSKWEGGTCRLYYDEEMIKSFDDPAHALEFARIENHYFTNNAFFENDNFIIDNVNTIRHIPCAIVQGRYDVVCPMKSAWDLHKAWPESQLHVVPDAGHSSSEPGILDKLVEATDAFRELKWDL